MSGDDKHYRKRPVVVEAVQWHKQGDHPAVQPLRRPDPIDCELCGHPYEAHGAIRTLEDTDSMGHLVCPADWVIKGVKGEHYACKPEIFALTYEPVAVSHVAAPAQVLVVDDDATIGREAMRKLLSEEPSTPSSIAPHTELERFMDWAGPAGFTLDHLFMASGGVPDNPFEDRDTKIAFDIWLARARLSAIAAIPENAARYEWLRSRTGADRFGFQLPYPALHSACEGVNLLKGSVAEHLDNAIDKLRSATTDGSTNG